MIENCCATHVRAHLADLLTETREDSSRADLLPWSLRYLDTDARQAFKESVRLAVI